MGDQQEYLKRMEGASQIGNWDRTQQTPPANNTFKVKPRKSRDAKRSKSKSKGFQDFVPKIKE